MTIETKDSYEQRQLQEIQNWKNEKPGVVSEFMGSLFKPLSRLFDNALPVNTIQSAIESCNGASKSLIDMEAFKREANITEIGELRSRSLPELDMLANEAHNWAIGIATTEGAATGAAGLAGMALDIPAIITLSLRTINKIALCYGFQNNNDDENQIVLSILSVAGANSIEEKEQALTALQNMVAKNPHRQVAGKTLENEVTKEAAKILIKALTKQLGVNLTKRKALQAVPVIGAAVGASVNDYFIKDTGWAARRIYQERWLKEKYTAERTI
ncbi:EcsC family protein [Flavobacterium album]|uniref:EcsC family protein n=1 Tax=Flavobacterium album TaxID=2175091 RepID=A0A2S1QYP3_9FLAO|nr:EcsC family protein [Flavobacterium album]AWH85533.1 EcsC family protein [Flavobacterium album]